MTPIATKYRIIEKARQVDPSIAEKAASLVATYSRYFPSKQEIFFRPDL